MSLPQTPRIVIGMLVLCTVAGSVWLGVHRARLSAEALMEQDANTLARQADELSARTELVAKARVEQAALADELAALTSARPEPEPTKTHPSQRPDSLALLRNDPSLQVLNLAAQSAVRRMMYRPLMERLPLRPEQVSAFEEILQRREEQMMDLRHSALEQGLAVDDAKLAPLWTEIHRQADDALRALLGQDGFGAFRDYERGAALREVVGAVAGAAALAGAALTRQQAEALFEVCAASSESYRRGEAATPQMLDWDAVDVAAARHLSPARMRILQSVEAMGARGMGGRHLPRLNFLIHQAQEREAKTGPTEGSTSSSEPSG